MPFHPNLRSGHSFLQTFFEVGTCLSKPSNYWYCQITQGIFFFLLSHPGEKNVVLTCPWLFKSISNRSVESKNMFTFLIYFNFYQTNTCTQIQDKSNLLSCVNFSPTHCTFLSFPLILLARHHHILSELFLLHVCSPVLGAHASIL